ncbi:MAG: Crp/Fnr family transcriptional regulator [Coriobacteriales bacterium]|nr:Crp/Fnr family transcriptional regulator [Coriobacteriales bacterium]
MKELKVRETVNRQAVYEPTSYCEEWSPWSDDAVSDELVQKLMPIATLRSYGKGALIPLERVNDNLYLLLAGTVEVSLMSEAGRKRILALHEERTFIDDALLSEGSSVVMVTCLTKAEFAILDRAKLTRLAYQDPTIFDCILKSVLYKLQGLTQHLVDQTFNEVEDRIINLLSSFAKSHGRSVDNGIRIEKPLTHEFIAEMVGSTRVRVTQSIKSLQTKGRLTKAGKYYTLC